MFSNTPKNILVLSLLLASNMAHSYSIEGKVYCDSNENGQIDTSDETLGGIVVEASHQKFGNFSSISAHGDHPYSGGRYKLTLPSGSTIPYVLSLDESTLPSDSEFIAPDQNNLNVYLNGNNRHGYQDWLINSSACHESIPTPSVEICTQVTLNPDMISDFSDADSMTGDSCDALTQGIPTGIAGAVDGIYKLIVTNNGPETLIDASITAPDFGLVNEPIPASCGSLLSGESCTIQVSDPNSAYQALKVTDICSIPMTVTKQASVKAIGESSGIMVSDDDPASILCTTEPHITLIKEVSLNGGVFVDANSPESAPFGTLGSDAEYRLTIINDGTETLENMSITDASLGINMTNVGQNNLAPGQSIILTQNSNGFSALFVTSRCDSTGTILNTAKVEANGVHSDIGVSSEDLAYIRCANPQINLLKQVSLDGINYFDADLANDSDVPVALVGKANAHYRFIVSNIGSEALSNILVTDSKLNIDTVIDGLAIGETRIIDSSESGFHALYKTNICDGESGNKSNIAQVDAIGLNTGQSVSDSNPANIKCISGPQIELLKQVRLNSSANFEDADTINSSPSGLLGDDAEYRLVIRNVGDERLKNIVVNDSVLGISNISIANLGINEEVVLNSSSTGFQKLMAKGHCDAIGSKLNIANVRAMGSLSNTSVTDEDPAYIRCEAPVSCDLTVDQTCSVKVSSSDNKLCTDSISATTLRYTGPDMQNATVVFTGKDSGTSTYNNINLISNLTILKSANGYSVDAGIGNKLGSKTTITINGKAEIIHTSCSAIYVAGQAAPLDSETPFPSNVSKGDPSPNWDVVSFRQKDDIVIEETTASSQGLDSCNIPYTGAELTYNYKITNKGTTPIKLTSVLDDQLGEVLKNSPSHLASGEMLTLSSAPIFVKSTTTNTVTAFADVEPYNASNCSATDSVNVISAPAPEYSCADGKPIELGITYVGGSCSDSNHTQGTSKSSCSGSSAGKEPVTLVISNKNGSELARSEMYIGDSMTFNNSGSKLDSETNAAIYHKGQLIQSINVHTSCSVPLIVGDQHGGIIISSFKPEASGSGKGSKAKGSKAKGSKAKGSKAKGSKAKGSKKSKGSKK